MKNSVHNLGKAEEKYFFDRCQEITDILAKIYNARIALVTEIIGKDLVVRAASDNSQNPYSVGDVFAYDENLFCFRVINSRSSLFVENKKSDASPSNPSSVSDDCAEVAYFGYPIFLSNGDLYGTLCIMEANPSQDINKVRISIEKFKLILERELSAAAYRQIVNQSSTV